MQHSIHEFLYVYTDVHIQAYTTNANSEPTQSSQGSSTNNFCHVPLSKTSLTPGSSQTKYQVRWNTKQNYNENCISNFEGKL